MKRFGRSLSRCYLSRPLCRFRSIALAVTLIPLASAFAQTRPQDPLMSMMMSQPRIDLSGPVTATAAFDPPQVRPGQVAIYRVVFTALEQMVQWPAEVPAPAGLVIKPGAHGQFLQPGGAGLQPRSTFNSRATAERTGSFEIASFVVQVDGKPVSIPAARLEVTENPAPQPFSQKLLLEVSKTNLFIGEPVGVQVSLPGTSGVVGQAGPPVQFPGTGFLIDQSVARQRFEMRTQGGTNLPNYIYETVLIPIDGGQLSVSAQAHAPALNIITSANLLPGNGPPNLPALYTLLETDPITLKVQPLPSEGVLPGFSGAIGRLSLDPARLETNALRVGDPVKLTVVVRGQGPMGRLVPPPPPQVRDWQVFPAGPATAVQPVFTPGMSIAARLAAMGNLVGFTYTLVPLVDSVKETPAIPFSYFDPDKAAYVDLTVPPLPVTVVSREGVPGDLAALTQADERPALKEPVLGSLARSPGWGAHSLVPVQQRAWFPLAQLAPAAAFLALWLWDRRRRFLELHPEVVARRRARRLLRRERRRMRRAAGWQDSQEFALCAIEAVRAGCAPDFEADPRALIGSDVLQVIRDLDRRMGHAPGEPAVRRLFEAQDAFRFGSQSGEAATLYQLRPELERVLNRLEERL